MDWFGRTVFAVFFIVVGLVLLGPMEEVPLLHKYLGLLSLMIAGRVAYR